MAAARPLPSDVRHVILDRDGVLNVEALNHQYILRPDDFHWLPGSLSALAALTRAGLYLSVATNQSAVGRGLMTGEDLDLVLNTMQSQAEAAGARLGGIYFCPHTPDAQCDCRKPAPGLLFTAIAESGIAAAQTAMIGDDERDIVAARAAGITPVLVRTGKGAQWEKVFEARGDTLPVFDDLAQFARAFSQGLTTS